MCFWFLSFPQNGSSWSPIGWISTVNKKGIGNNEKFKLKNFLSLKILFAVNELRPVLTTFIIILLI